MAKSNFREKSKVAPQVQALRNPRILIVEDDLNYAFGLMRALKGPIGNVSFEVDVVTDVISAVPYLQRDLIDIYVIDLSLEPLQEVLADRTEASRQLISDVVERSNAGIIVNTSLPTRTEAEGLLLLGIDDFIEKGSDLSITQARVLALWRRIQIIRPAASQALASESKAYLISGWRFVSGDRVLKSDNDEAVRLSYTEHALVRALCTAKDNEINREDFNVSVLGRPASDIYKRLDSLVYRLRQKLKGIELVSKRDGAYRLLSVKELKPDI